MWGRCNKSVLMLLITHSRFTILSSLRFVSCKLPETVFFQLQPLESVCCAGEEQWLMPTKGLSKFTAKEEIAPLIHQETGFTRRSGC